MRHVHLKSKYKSAFNKTIEYGILPPTNDRVVQLVT